MAQGQGTVPLAGTCPPEWLRGDLCSSKPCVRSTRVKPEGFPCLRSFFGTGNFVAHGRLCRSRLASNASRQFSVAIDGTP